MFPDKIQFIFVGTLIICVYYTMASQDASPPRKIGCTGGLLGKDPETVQLIQKIKPDFEQKIGKPVKELAVIHYRRQLVNGVNFFIKAKVVFDDDSSSIAHLRIYTPFQGEPELNAYQLDKTLEEKLEYFQ